MKAILLAAGLGTRLSPLTRVLPKCLVPVNGRPLLEYWLRSLDAAGVGEVLVNTHHLAGTVRAWLEAGPWAGRVRVVHEPELLGTGGTLVANRDFVGGEPVLLVHADNLCAADLRAFADRHRARPAAACLTMMTFRAADPRSCGIVELDGDGLVRAFHEKVESPPGDLANAAVYILEPEVLEFAAGLGRDVVDFSTEVLPRFLGRMQTFHNAVYHRDLGSVDSLLAAQADYPGEAEPPVRDDAWRALCERDGGALPAAVARSLAEALGLPLLDAAEVREADAGRAAVLFCRDLERLDRTMGLLHKSGSAGSACVAFLERVPPGFSSRRLFRRLGLRSLAACASAGPRDGEGRMP